jgi:hypothetical protein
MSPYTKLTPRHRTFGGYTQLWLAPDHLLLLCNTRFSEEYKRFSFSDIQAIVVTRLPSQLVLQIVMILAALAWMCLWFAVDSRFAKWAIEISGALALLFLIVDMARGPRCRCFLRTRVSGELLAPVSRIKTADNFVALLRPVIESVQGALPAEGVTFETPDSGPPPPDIVSSPGYLPEFLFATFLVNALLLWSTARFPKVPELPAILLNTLFAEFVLIVVALLRRKGRDARVVVYVILGLSIVGIGFDIVTFGGELVRWYMTVLDKAKNGEKTITPLTFLPKNGMRLTIAYAWRAVAGVVGLAAAFFERPRQT